MLSPDLTTFYLGWFGGVFFIGFFLPHEYREPAQKIHDAMRRKGLDKTKARIPYDLRRDIKGFCLVSATFALVTWFILEAGGFFFNVDVSTIGLIFALFPVFLILPAGAAAFRLDSLEQEWIEEGENGGSTFSAPASPKDDHDEGKDDENKQKGLGGVSEASRTEVVAEDVKESNGEHHEN